MLKRITGLLIPMVVLLTTSLTSAATPFLQLAYLHGTDSYLVDCNNVAIVSLDGGVTQDITLSDFVPCGIPTWSPDGAYLVLYDLKLNVLDMEHGGVQIINNSATDGILSSAIWSQDGKYLASKLYHGHNTMSTDGGYTSSWSLMNWATGAVQSFESISQMQIAPDEIRYWIIEKDYIHQEHIVLFHTNLPPQVLSVSDSPLQCLSPMSFRWETLQMLCTDGYDISRLDGNTQTIVKLTDTPNLQEYYAEWSPDGTQIVYQVTEMSSGKTWLQIMASDGSNVRRLTKPTDDNVTPVFMVSSGVDTIPHWSPDGQYIAFQRQSGYKGLDSKVYVIKADGTQLQYVGDGVYPAWRPINRS